MKLGAARRHRHYNGTITARIERNEKTHERIRSRSEAKSDAEYEMGMIDATKR